MAAKKSKRSGELEELPEACIATILSHTSPTDACRLSVVSKTLHSASDSDDVWNYFLPSDSNLINSIISQYPSLANASTKKAMFLALALSDRRFIVDDGKKSFQLVKKSGKICYMLSARSLTIDCESNANRKEMWISNPNSRFPEVAELCNVSRFEIHGTINTLSLSPNTQYAAYLVFKMNGAYVFKNEPAKLSVSVEGGRCKTKSVCLDPHFRYVNHHRHVSGGRRRQTHCKCIPLRPPEVVGLQRPFVRSDRWFEIEMGIFFNSNLQNKEVRMSVIQEKGSGEMENFFLEGIEARPKDDDDDDDDDDGNDDDDDDDNNDDDDDDGDDDDDDDDDDMD